MANSDPDVVAVAAVPNLAFRPAAPLSFVVCTAVDSGLVADRALCYPCLGSLVSCCPCSGRSSRRVWIRFVADGVAMTGGANEKDVMVAVRLLDYIVVVHAVQILEIAAVAEEVVPTFVTTWGNCMAKVVLQKDMSDLKSVGASDLSG